MKHGYLSEYFAGAAGKRLSAVETDRSKSNQHEFQIVAAMTEFLGTPSERVSIPTTFIYFGSDEPEPLIEESYLTLYDSRKKQSHRSAEYRAYFPDIETVNAAQEGDLLVIAKLRDGNGLLAIIAEQGSTEAGQLEYLFGFKEPDTRFIVRSNAELDSEGSEINFAARIILDQIGVRVEPEDESGSHLEALLEQFGNQFPNTRTFSAYARETLSDMDPVTDPDGTLIAWVEQEEKLFRILEHHLLLADLKDHFPDGVTDIDLFLKVSLAVQNRRKSRAGHALEHHVAEVLHRNGVKFEQGAQTENRSKPDFLFPSAADYHTPSFSADRLVMLGVKSTLKDRWRQVLAEADRIPSKHLLTLQPAISNNQVQEMKANNLQLVVPRSLHTTFPSRSREYLLDFEGFIRFVKTEQAGT